MTETTPLTCDDCGEAVQLHLGGYSGALHVACDCDDPDRVRGVKASSVIPEAWR